MAVLALTLVLLLVAGCSGSSSNKAGGKQARKPVGIAHPLLAPSDYAGLRIGVQQSRVTDATMRALGATPVWFPSQGAIAGFGGIEQQIDSIQGNHYYRVAKYVTANVSLWPRP